MNRRTLIAALAMMPIVPAYASGRSGGRLEAVSSGRIYDRILTPRLNPSFSLEPRAEYQLLRDIRRGRVDTSLIPPGRLRYLLNRLDNGR